MARSHAEAKGTKGAPDLPAPTVPPETQFETALSELEHIVQNMESGHFSLEESIAAYHRGSELLRHCQKQLSDAERKIQIFERGELRDALLDEEKSR